MYVWLSVQLLLVLTLKFIEYIKLQLNTNKCVI